MTGLNDRILNFLADFVANIDAGVAPAVGTVNSGAYKDTTVTFHKSFKSVPVVVAGFHSDSTAGTFGRCTVGVHSITATGCKIRVFNGDTAARSPGIRWIAMAP